jgi:tetratricopeptide (TPR) repeat protein
MRMADPAKKIMENLSRAKAAYIRGETLRPMLAVAEAVKLMATAKVHSMDRGRIDTLLRENLANISRLEDFRRHGGEPLSYARGEEKKLFARLVPVIKKIKEERDRESMEAMRERKYKIDRLLVSGRKFLEHKKIEDAREQFRQAAELYEDEDAMFTMMAEAMIRAGFGRESLEHLRRALEIDPSDRKACELAYQAAETAGDMSMAEEFFAKAIGKHSANAHLLLGLARARLKRKKYAEALEAAEQSLEHDPDLVMAGKVRDLAAARAKAKAS